MMGAHCAPALGDKQNLKVNVMVGQQHIPELNINPIR
jgi:hypothetical protein